MGRMLDDLFPENLAPGSPVSGYLAIGDEFDVAPLLEDLSKRHFVPCLPVVTGRAEALSFRRWRPGDPLEDGPLGTRHPVADAEACTPALLLVPLLAFDRQGYRLGWGGGFYDRTLRAIRGQGIACVAAGIAYAGQEVDAVPRDAYDEPLDWVLTDREAIRVSR